MLTVFAIALLISSFGAGFPTQDRINKQAAPDSARGASRVVLVNTSLPEFTAIQPQIDALQKKFTEQNQIDIFLDLAPLAKNGLILWWSLDIDATKSFIEACKEFQNMQTMTPIKPAIPAASIAVLDAQAMYDPNSGIKQLVRRIKEAARRFPNPNDQKDKKAFDDFLKEVKDSMFQALEAFAKENGFNLVFNTSAQANLSVYSLQSTDITRRFIDNYNRLHP